MAGTKLKEIPDVSAFEGSPVVVLVDPQLGENIGMVARAMLNCGLIDLRLVRPRDGWPNPKAVAAASRADVVLDRVQLFETTAEAVADLHTVYATTARSRDMNKLVFTPRKAAQAMRSDIAEGLRSGILFGKEAKGLHNDDIALADAIITAPLNPAFSSLNLAQGVLLTGYEWFAAADETPDAVTTIKNATQRATKDELVGFFEHLEDELDECGFLTPVEKRPSMVRNLRNIFQRAQMTEQEVRTLRGVVAGLTRAHKKKT